VFSFAWVAAMSVFYFVWVAARSVFYFTWVVASVVSSVVVASVVSSVVVASVVSSVVVASVPVVSSSGIAVLGKVGDQLVEGCRRGCATSAPASAVSSRLLLSGSLREQVLDNELSWVSVASRGLDESHHLFKEPSQSESSGLK
jgi:hypothetical protein